MAETVVTADPSSERTRSTRVTGWLPRAGVLAWSFIGIIVAAVIVTSALAAVSEIALPLTFAAVLAVLFEPAVRRLVHRGLRPTIASGTVVLALIALMAGVTVAVVNGVTAQADQIGESVQAAIVRASETFSLDTSALESARAQFESAAAAMGGGFLTRLVSGVSGVIGFASGCILGALIMYYMLKDGSRLRGALVRLFDPAAQQDVDDFVGDGCQILRSYGRGRTVMSAIVSLVITAMSLILGLPLVFTIAVVNFIGGYIPYIGAFIGGGLAVVIAFGEGGLAAAVIMLVVVLTANLLLENFVEPKVMGRTLDIHPLVVLIVTALGGLLGGIVGLILAVPFTLIAANAVTYLRRSGVFAQVATRAEPALEKMLD